MGYDVTKVKKSYLVLEMSCASCAVSIESILKSQWSVVNANVNFATANVFIEYIPEMVQAESLKKVVQSSGFDLMIDESNSSDETIGNLQAEKFSNLKKKTYCALALSVPVVVIGMFFMEMPFANEIMWVLSTPVLFWLGRDFYINAWKQAKHRSANMDTLVALSRSVAYVFSLFNTLFPELWHQKGLHPQVYFEAASVIIGFILLGRLLEEKAKSNTSSAIKKLMGLQSKIVTIVTMEAIKCKFPSKK